MQRLFWYQGLQQLTWVNSLMNSPCAPQSQGKSSELVPPHVHINYLYYMRNQLKMSYYKYLSLNIGVTPSRILLLVLSSSFSHFLARVYYPSDCTKSQPHLSLAWMVEMRLLWGLRVYIGVLTYGKFLQILLLPWVRDVGHGCSYGYFAQSIYILVTFISW